MTDLQRIREIQEDAKRDAYALDGKQFNGKEVGAQFGQTLALIAALAAVVERQMKLAD